MKHWTERSVGDFLYRIAADFVAQLETKIEAESLNKADLAQKLGISKGRVSQIFNNPGNLSLKTIIKFARALGMKVTIVAYDDKDQDNARGPINSEIFRICWENSGKPADFWSLQESRCVATSTATIGIVLEARKVVELPSHSGQRFPVITWPYSAHEQHAVVADADVGQNPKVQSWQPDNIREWQKVATTPAFGQEVGRTLH
ncbi:MAG: helix-turn-helix transcriptional regulator [Deltaproteobacteria bacterium]|nr:helix-turn-helix transcriptional regulator [Deltaproteobacteria bacterium]